MPRRFDSVTDRRAIIDRRTIFSRVEEAPAERKYYVEILREALADGAAELQKRIDADPGDGRAHAYARAYLIDQIVRIAFEASARFLFPNPSPSSGERLTICAVGGYGRGEMAPYSDVDLLFVVPGKLSAWSEQVVESVLYTLWDLSLKVGHATRSPQEIVRLSREDTTIRTAMLETRFICGDQDLYDEAGRVYRSEVVHGTERDFIREKLAERDARHKRMGDSRYVVEPNVKEGKGGLRDLQTLFWIGKYCHRVERAAELVDAGLFEPEEYRLFNRAEDFLLAVRTLLHHLNGRAEERLTFDMQRRIAELLGYQDRAGASAVERFMRHYFLIAKSVGDLTGLFLEHIEEEYAGFRERIRSRTSAPSHLNGFTLSRGRIGIPDESFFQDEPRRLLELFALAEEHGHEIHPLAMRQASRDAQLISDLQDDERANDLFMQVLTSPRDPETVLRWMNEAGVFGRFVPDFGRVVARMQFDMYHHYTVDEHTIRAVGLLSQIERGLLKDEHPISTDIMQKVGARQVIYTAVLLHDIAKGRGGDHSELGAEIALELCPRLGLGPAETETVSWLVRYHLLMSATAFKRDLSDAKTIEDFVAEVQSLERLRLLTVLTVVDIRAVGPGTWTAWKAQLISNLFTLAEERLRLGHQRYGREEKIAAKQHEAAERLGWDDERMDAYAARFFDSYWIAEDIDTLVANARQIETPEEAISIEFTFDEDSGLTQVRICSEDHPGLLMRIAGAIGLAGADIADARIHTTRDGMAINNLLVTSSRTATFTEPDQLERLKRTVCDALAGKVRLKDKLASKPPPLTRAEAFSVAPRVLVQSGASNRFTVIEVNAADRPGLLHALLKTLFDAQVSINSAHITTYGERAVDTFYLTDLTGQKLDGTQRLKDLEARLLNAARTESRAAQAA
ncbi:[protein-PII] uridylyltransferase [Pacificimonas flava]|uniref:Bifunctional uridylyltransferase/uridylyl-removing enzyme n=2 Tax=Pacificimonas TaxID=1960290 RepID=A0A219B3V8_9SPHN|nr:MULTISPECIES: [protein-PII] uridylyltransferase [Pacificimonas]MBZ6377838.1 [protein-PII] uridylyltransferase [Pacificimonas aurantium]OWV32499.1 [protein-PII] uridylyltransferase [Pacificimonas flava]